MSRCKSNLKVVCYHLDGRLYKIFDSAKLAAEYFNAFPRTIDKCIRGDTLTAKGYLWRRYPLGEIPDRIEQYKKKSVSSTSIPIAEIDKDGNILHYYSSIKKAGKELGIDPHSIRDVLNHKSRQSNGHVFRYLNNDELNNRDILVNNRE